MAVARVLVLWSVWTWVAAGAESTDGVAVKEEVERIFKSVEQFMSGNTPEVRRKFKAVENFVSEDSTEARRKNKSQKQSPGVSESRYRVRDPSADREVPEEQPVLMGTKSSDVIRPLTTFPLGVILSDNLYPLVVGKNVDSGKPFVADLSKQHALVVARTEGQGRDYRLMIPFPSTVDTASGADAAEYPSPSQPYSYSHSRPDVDGYNAYREEPLHSRHPINNVQYAPDYQHHGYRTEDGLPLPQYNRYPKKYSSNQNYRAYPRDRPYTRNENYNSYLNFPHNSPTLRSPQNHAYLQKPKEQISYHVAGPKYRPAYLSTVKKYVPRGYQGDQPRYPLRQRGGDRFVQPVYGSFPTNLAADSGPRQFKPSPYIGNITEDVGSRPRQHYEVDHLEPQSEVFENYDDKPIEFTEQDYLDSIRNSPELHSSSGGVRHVTYHADDYLGKIYEEMYYRLPEPAKEELARKTADERVDVESVQRQGIQVSSTPRQGVAENKTEASKWGPTAVSFHEVNNKQVEPSAI